MDEYYLYVVNERQSFYEQVAVCIKLWLCTFHHSALEVLQCSV